MSDSRFAMTGSMWEGRQQDEEKEEDSEEDPYEDQAQLSEDDEEDDEASESGSDQDDNEEEENDDDEDEEEEEEEKEDKKENAPLPRVRDEAFEHTLALSLTASNEDIKLKKKSKKIQGMSEKQLSKFREAHKKSGVVYLGRIPPFMGFQKVRHLLEQYGEIGRVYLAPEDNAVRRKRIKFKQNKAKNFTDGWVEFANKKVAKRVARDLNNTRMVAQKRSRYYDDLWNIKYLKGFKWQHLTEKIAYEQSIRSTKIREEMGQQKRQNTFFLNKVEQAKKLSGMNAKKKRKAESQSPLEAELTRQRPQKVLRSFKQREAVVGHVIR